MNLEQVIEQYRSHGLVGEVGGHTLLRSIHADAVTGHLELRKQPSRLGKHTNRLEEIRSMARAAGLRDAAAEDLDKRTFQFVASDDTCDRYNSRILVDGKIGSRVFGKGWQLSDFKKNPVFQWCHTYDTIPLGNVVDVYPDTKGKVKRLLAAVVIGDGRANPMAPLVCAAYGDGLMRAVSVGFDADVDGIYYPQDIDEAKELGLDPGPWNMGYIVGEQDLWEISAVPVPGNANALLGKGVEQGEAKRWLAFADRLKEHDQAHAYQIRAIVSGAAKGVSIMEITGTRGSVPKDVSKEKADPDTAWSKPNLSDFTDKQWEDLSTSEKTRISGHYAYTKNSPPESFGDLLLPHHRAEDGAVVLKGVIAAAGRMNQADIPSDGVDGVKKHLENHYHAFDKKAPWEEADGEKAAEAMARDLLWAGLLRAATGEGDATDGDGDEGAPSDPADQFSTLTSHLHKARLACNRTSGHVAKAHEHLDAAHGHLDTIDGKKSARSKEGDGEGSVQVVDGTAKEEPGELYEIDDTPDVKAKAHLRKVRGKLGDIQQEMGSIHRALDKAHSFMDAYGSGGTGKGDEGTGGPSSAGAVGGDGEGGAGGYTELSAQLKTALEGDDHQEVARLAAMLTARARGGTISQPSPAGASGPAKDLMEVTQRLVAVVGDLQQSLAGMAKGGRTPKGAQTLGPDPADIDTYRELLTVLDDSRAVIREQIEPVKG
jgi:hypothetical protein